LFAAARSCLALTWKLVIFVELMGRSSGVGYRIQYFYSLFNMERVLASALPFMLMMLLIELVVLRQRYLDGKVNERRYFVERRYLIWADSDPSSYPHPLSAPFQCRSGPSQDLRKIPRGARLSPAGSASRPSATSCTGVVQRRIQQTGRSSCR